MAVLNDGVLHTPAQFAVAGSSRTLVPGVTPTFGTTTSGPPAAPTSQESWSTS